MRSTTPAESKILNLVYYPDPLLRKIARPVLEFNDALVDLGNKLQATLNYQVYKGLLLGASLSKGLAAPQIGFSKRIIIGSLYGRIRLMVNPEIIEKSGSYISKERCLSLPSHPEKKVRRSQNVFIRYFDLQGNENNIVLKARFAASFQHELDHLNGVLYIDKKTIS